MQPHGWVRKSAYREQHVSRMLRCAALVDYVCKDSQPRYAVAVSLSRPLPGAAMQEILLRRWTVLARQRWCAGAHRSR